MPATQPKGSSEAATRERNKAVVRRILEAFNTGDTKIIDELASPDLFDFTPIPGRPAGLEGLKQQIPFVRKQFSDAHFEEELIIAEGDMVFLQWKMTGTNTGSILGRPPTGKRITHRGHEIVRLKDGLIVEHRDVNDMLEFLDKLGLLDEAMLKYVQTLNEATTRERNKAVVRRILQAFNSGDAEIIDELASPNLVDFTPIPGRSPDLKGLKQQIPFVRKQFSDVRFEEEFIIAEGDMVYLQWKMTGTNTGSILGRPPTGKQVTHHGNELVRLEDGLIVEHRDTNDMLEFLDKLGLLDEAMLKHLKQVESRSHQ